MVGLKYAPNLVFSDLELDSQGIPVRIYCTLDVRKTVKPKTHIHWLPKNHSLNVPVVKYLPLAFTDGACTSDGSEKLEYLQAKIEDCLEVTGTGKNYQFERLGFYILDRNSTAETPRYLETISLKKTW